MLPGHPSYDPLINTTTNENNILEDYKMKIARPVDDKTMETTICPSFGRAPYFLFYDTVTGEGEFMENSASTSQGGAGIKAAQTIVDSKSDTLITPRCGENAAEIIKAANIEIYKSTESSASDTLDAFRAGKLSILGEIHPGFHGHGGK